MNNGYQEFYINNVHYYAHRYAAEQMLGRPLLNTEVVHHKDRDRSNNDPSNLMVFKTTADHSAYHAGVPIKKEGDVWVADYDKFTSSDAHYNICPGCGKLKRSTASYCKECYLKNKKSQNISMPKLSSPKKSICPNCGKPKTINAKYCLECYSNYFIKRKVENRPDKETLYDLITLYPFTTIASFYGVSDKTISKWCKSYNLPYLRRDIKMDTFEEFVN